MKEFRLVTLRPSEIFGTRENALQISGLPDMVAESLPCFQLPLIAIVVGNDHLPHPAACNFLLECALSSKGTTGDTARSYGEALCDWLNFLRLSQCEPSEATEERLGLYRLHLLGAGSGGRNLRGTTANHRLVVAAEFQRWGQRSQILRSPLGDFLERTRQNAGGRRYANLRRRNPSSYLAAVDKRLPKILTQEEIVRLFKVAPRPFDLMFRWAIGTGMRRVEICDLRLDQLPSPAEVSRQEGGLVMIDVRRKGGRLQSVAVPSRLVEETYWYAITERHPASPASEAHVFIGCQGLSVSRQRMTRVFRDCANRIGSTATLHHLRHTFAVNVLQALEHYEGGGQAMNPLKCIQVLLGHASLETTQIYLQAMSMGSDAVRQALDYLYGGTIA
jgi:integrase